jgi:precorrin-4 C11-methyltransferase
MKTAIILVSESSLPIAKTLQAEIPESKIYAKHDLDGCVRVGQYEDVLMPCFNASAPIIFIGAMGICVRAISPWIFDKHTDSPVVCVDGTGRYAIPVVSGHVGGANDLARHVASILGAEAVITTRSDNELLWPLDTLGREYGWETYAENMNVCIAHFVNRKPTALLLGVKDKGAEYLERTSPEHVDVFFNFEDIPQEKYGLIINVSPFVYETSLMMINYRPKVLHIGVGCRKGCSLEGVAKHVSDLLVHNGLSTHSIASVGTIELKSNEPMIRSLAAEYGLPVSVYEADELKDIDVPNPSAKVVDVTGVPSVAEAVAIKSSNYGPLLLEKNKCCLSEGNDFTFAVAMDSNVIRCGHIEIVGAGPGDPELVSVRGKHFLQKADLILYAGSLVPRELTYYAKQGAVVRSSASMTLEEQFELMKEFYDRGMLVVRLHTGDPCIYGAIQEQMAFFDRYGMRYHITPGISSFQAAAAALRSQFTIPEKVQTIILTRGEGRTPMPEKEQLHKLAQSHSTMCIYLSAGIVDQVQEELLQAYPPETPVAACYKLTWKEERIYRGQLIDLAKIVKENNLTLTTLLVVGEAIDNRQGLSKLYSHEFKHLFRK